MTPRIREAAEADILHQVDRYAAQGLPGIARRFHAAVLTAMGALAAMPEAGAPRHFADPRLTGLRVWPVRGFDSFLIYYTVEADAVSVIRVLHGKRDVAAELGGRPGTP